MLLDERHLRFHCGRDVGGDEARRACANHDQIAVEPGRPRPFRIDTARLHHLDGFLGEQWENTEEGKREQQPERKDSRQRIDIRELGARVHVDDRPSQHAELAHPVVGAHRQCREPHRQIDQKKRKRRYQPQRKEVEGTLLRNTRVDRLETFAKARLHGIAEQEPCCEKRKRGPER